LFESKEAKRGAFEVISLHLKKKIKKNCILEGHDQARILERIKLHWAYESGKEKDSPLYHS